MSTNTNHPSPASGKRNHDHRISSGYKHPGSQNVSIFKNAKNPRIKNSPFTVNTIVHVSGDSTQDPLQKLYDQVSQNAILNAGGRADEVRCYPGTREEVISLMDRWMDGEDGAASGMMWLSGPAGAGKSAIMQTMAERCKQRGVPAASFFFFRADTTRSNAQPLVATLLYQIFDFHPPARQTITNVLSKHPLVFGASIQDQFNQLLLPPLQDIPQPQESPARRPIVLLIDGLDECDSDKQTPQRQILQALDYLLTRDDCRFLVLIASRAEPHITMAVKELVSPVQSIFLDDEYQPEEDIRAFVTGEFNRIKKVHHLAHTLGANWPSNGDIETIVKKSSGQFIFAATVMRFISNSAASPQLSLKRVQGIIPATTNSPFAHLDAIYTYIFSKVDDIKLAMDLLSAQLLRDSVGGPYQIVPATILCTYNPTNTFDILSSCVADLTAILQFQDGDLVFYHASLPDFLTDKSRAGEYHIDPSTFGVKVLPGIWTALTVTVPNGTYTRSNSWDLGFLAMSIFSTLQMSTPDITKAFLMSSPAQLKMPADNDAIFPGIDLILHNIHRLYYRSDVKTYRKLMRQWVSWYLIYAPHYWSLARSWDHNLLRLPYVTTLMRIHKIEHWVTRILQATLRRKP